MALPTADKSGLAMAVAKGDIEEVEALLNRGSEINQKSSDGFAPLCIAAFWGYADIVKLLLERGADVNVVNKGTGWTPCHCAAFQGHGKVMLYLSSAKPDLSIRDSAGRTAADFGSAMDVVWPFFAAMGCQRTSKVDLIRMDIIKKSEPPIVKSTERASASGSLASHLSRPSSSYLINTALLQPTNSGQISAALAYGDILHEDTGQDTQTKTALNLWRT